MKRLNRKKKTIRNEGFALVEAMILLVIFSIIGTSIMALCTRKVISAAKSSSEMSERLALYQSASVILEKIKTNVADDSDLSNLFGETNGSFTLYVNADLSDDLTDEEKQTQIEKHAVEVSGYDCKESGESSETTTTYNVTFTATNGNKLLFVTANVVKDATADTVTINVTQWNYGNKPQS